MKILVIGNRKHQFVYNYVKSLRKYRSDSNLQIDVLSQDKDSKKENTDVFFDHVYSLSTSNPLYKNRFFRILFQLFSLVAYLNRLKSYDIIHIHYLENIIIWNYFFTKQIKGKLVISIWGSDFLRASNRKRHMMIRIFDRADQITIASPTVKLQFEDFYKGKYNDKITICQFGLQPLEYFANTNLEDLDRKKKELGLNLNKIIITIGYNASRLQRHKEIIECIEKDKKLSLYKDKIEFLLPCTYPKDPEYLESLSLQISESSFHYTIINDFLSDESVARLRCITNIFIQLQPTDMLSGSMLEHLAAGNIVITGKWLPYEVLDDLNINMYKIERVDKVAITLNNVLENYSEYADLCKLNKKIVLDNFRWKAVINKWIKMYEKVLR